MTKDPFRQLVDEITLIRDEVASLRRTSLDRDEASELHGYFMRDIESLRETYNESPEVFKDALKADRDQMARTASKAATEAAERVMGDMRDQLNQERLKFSQAAGEARREAWRYFGGIWVWAGLLLSLGAILGGSGVFWTQGRADAKEFARYPGVYCSAAGGNMIETGDGSWVYCAVPVRQNAPESN